jgi:molybdopterin molybdotransferase
MRGFRTRASVEDVIACIDRRVGALGAEAVPLSRCAGRVLAEPVAAGHDVPPFDRAAMDGYALRGEETFGSGGFCPALFRVVGAARPGRAFAGTVGTGEAVQIVTGAPLPAGADTVVKVEATRLQGEHALLVFEPTPRGRHVGRRGEDLRAGTPVFEAGRVLRPQDTGVLSALARGEVMVVGRPRLAIIVTGDELLPIGTAPSDYRIADMNSVMLAALVERDGGEPRILGPLADDREAIKAAIAGSAASADAVLVSGGSSTGPEDYAPGLVAELGELFAHGVGLRPASPSGLGFLGGVPVVLLPGNPVSCLCAYDFFAGRVVRRLGARPAAWPYRSIDCPLGCKLASALGRVDYARVRLAGERVEPLAISGASILSSTTRADGFVVVPADCEGYPAGATVRVWLYDA